MDQADCKFISVTKLAKSMLSNGLYFELNQAKLSCTFELDVNKP